MTHSNDPEFQPCFVTCACGEEYSLEPPNFETSLDKECECEIDHKLEYATLNKHLNGVKESSRAAQYRARSGGVL